VRAAALALAALSACTHSDRIAVLSAMIILRVSAEQVPS
jgi:hypothetical protein